MLANFAGVLFDGIAYGSLLFLISVGLSVTMGMMNFINLAHGAFAMLGGYVSVTVLARLGVPFLASLPLAFLASAAAGLVLERLLFGLEVGAYRLFLIGVVVLVTLALGLLIERTRFGAQIRAAVDNQTASAGLGINVGLVFSLTFALGSGLAGLGGGLGIDVLGLDPTFPVKYMVYFLLVVAVGGAGTIKGPLLAALILGVFDVAGKYYVPQVGAFVIYGLMVVLLILFPAGLIRRKA
jgi:branched-chain amino acid transport system permease protein